ncbi:MAG: conjugal transfer protein TraD [Methylococcaceae bacterium]
MEGKKYIMKYEILDLNQPGVVIDVDPGDACELGAFEETALSEEDAVESAKDKLQDS